MKQQRKLCSHCGFSPVTRPRGLCWACYFRPSVRAKYPRKTPDRQHETAEELEALVASRMAKLPKWWDSARPQGEGAGPRIPNAVSRGMGVRARFDRRAA